MLRIGMLLSCIFMSNTALNDHSQHQTPPPPPPSVQRKNELTPAGGAGHHEADNFDNYAVTCYICVNVSDNLICNQYAIDRPCNPDGALHLNCLLIKIKP